MEALRRAGRKGEGVFHRNEDGASALEFALVLPILIVLIFGAFTVGLGFDRKLSVEHAARDSSRFAATLPFTETAAGEPTDAWFEQVRDRAVAVSTGHLLANGADGTEICVAYVVGLVDETDPKLETSSRAIRYTSNGSGGWSQDTSADYCFDDELGDPYCDPGPPADTSGACSSPPAVPNYQERIQIETTRPFEFSAILIPVRTVRITATAVTRFEENSIEPTPTETATSP